MFATTLALLSMIPLTFLAISWIFHPSVAHFSQLFPFRHLDGSGFFASAFHHGWLTIVLAFSFLLTWNVIAMEAAACYIGETRNPDRDAKIAMNLEGGYGVFIYTMIPVAFVIVLGSERAQQLCLVDPKTIFVHFASKVFGAGAGSSVLNWLIAIMLILALILSALNAITGTARSLHQMSTDGQFPRFFQHVNRHGVPDRSMIVQRRLLDHRRVLRRRGRDLHLLQRRLPGLVHPGADRLLPAAKAPAERAAAVQAARVHEVRRAGPGAAVRGDLLLGRPGVRVLLVHRGGPRKTLPYYFIGIACCWPTCRCTTGASAATAATRPPRRRPRRSPPPDAAPCRGAAAVGRAIATAAPGVRFERILLASEGRPIPDAAIDRVVELASPSRRQRARVLDRARARRGVRTAQPGAAPDQARMGRAADLVDKAVKRLRRKGIKADGQVLGTRKSTRRILDEAAKERCDAIVMAADPDRNRIVGDLLWSQEPQRVRRRAKLPVSWCRRRVE